MHTEPAIAATAHAFADGCVATLSASRASYSAARKMRIWTDEGYAALDFGTRSIGVAAPSCGVRI